MWQRFTENARKIVFYAQEEAQRFGEGFVSTEHLLLGMLREPENLAYKVLVILKVDTENLRTEIEKQLQRGDSRRSSEMQLTPSCKKVIDYAYDDARNLNNNYIGSEHLLLGLLRDNEGLASRLLREVGVRHDDVMKEVMALQGAGEYEPFSNAISSQAEIKKVNHNTSGLLGLSLTSIADLTAVQALEIINVAFGIKERNLRHRDLIRFERPKTLAMIFERPSLRTRVSFEAAMVELGGHAIYLGPQEIKMGQRETAADIAATLSRTVDGIMARVNRHETLIALDDASSVPVINGLSDLEHPSQALADLMTFYEHTSAFEGKKLAWVGDGNNVCNSLMLLCSLIGVNMSVGCPQGYEPAPEIVEEAMEMARKSGSTLEIVNDAKEAVANADAIYTDVWTSLGHENEQTERVEAFKDFQINQELVSLANQFAIVLHCMPARRGEEITSEVLDGPQSAVLDQAENRLHVQKSILALLLGET